MKIKFEKIMGVTYNFESEYNKDWNYMKASYELLSWLNEEGRPYEEEYSCGQEFRFNKFYSTGKNAKNNINTTIFNPFVIMFLEIRDYFREKLR